MTMLRLKKEQHRILADKFPDLANLVAVALIFGQLLEDERVFSFWLGAVGFLVWLLLMGLSLLVTPENRQ